MNDKGMSCSTDEDISLCNQTEPEQRSVEATGMESNEPSSQESASTSTLGEEENFFKSNAGRYVITAIACIVIWGIIFAIGVWQSDATPIMAFVCVFFGWKALNRIQPAMFLWGTANGWLLYVCIKFSLSLAIGMFVAPFVIGKMIGEGIHNSIQ